MKYKLVKDKLVIPFNHFHEVWNYTVRNPGQYSFLVDDKPFDLKDYALDNMLIPAYRFK